jgi:hypothetical protein
MWQGFRQASMASWVATIDVRGPVLQWTMRLTTNQKIAGTVNTLTVWVTNCMGTVNTLSVPIQYTFYPPLSSPLPFSSPPYPPSSPTHSYNVKIYRNLKGTKYSSQVHKKYTWGARDRLPASYMVLWTVKELNTERPTLVFFWLTRNLSNHMDRQARTGDTVLVKCRKMTGT